MAELGASFRPVDVVLVAGLNNIMEGQTVEQIINEIKSLKHSIYKVDGSSLAVSTLPLPPSLSKLPNDNTKLGARDKTNIIINLNDQIREFNDEYRHIYIKTEYAPLFHTWGLQSYSVPRKNNPRQRLESLKSHREHQWREVDPARQLHFDDGVRLRMGRSVVKYFKAVYGIDKY